MMKPLPTVIVSTVIVLGVLLCLFSGQIAAQSSGWRSSSSGSLDPNEMWVLPKRNGVNHRTVTILSAPVSDATAIAVSDLTLLLDNDELRVLQVVGRGPVQNVIDLLDLHSIDMGVVVSDVPEFYKQQYNAPNIASKLRYIAKLYNNEIHIIAPTSIRTVFDLAGKKVMAPKDIGFYAAKSIFSRLNIRCTFDVQTEAEVALQTVANGDADAWIASTGKVMPMVRSLGNADGRLHLVSIPYESQLQELYLPSFFTSEDYPNLISREQKVETLAASVLLVAYDWEENGERYKAVAKFIDAFFSRIDEFDRPPRHPKWQEASISATMPGWERFKAAQDWLNLNQGSAVSASSLVPREDFKEFFYRDDAVHRSLSDTELRGRFLQRKHD
jgi:TRAP-type uncharacterized transport system substrate-binding protein